MKSVRNPKKIQKKPVQLEKVQPEKDSMVMPLISDGKPKRRLVGECGDDKLYQLEESTNCLDCFKSIPAGSLVAVKNVSTNICKIPVCAYFAGIDATKVSINAPITKIGCCSCPSFADGSVKGRDEYAKKVRSFREKTV